MDSLLAGDLPQPMVSPSIEAGGGRRHCRNGQHHVLAELGGHHFHHGALALRVALAATCLVSLRIETYSTQKLASLPINTSWKRFF